MTPPQGQFQHFQTDRLGGPGGPAPGNPSPAIAGMPRPTLWVEATTATRLRLGGLPCVPHLHFFSSSSLCAPPGLSDKDADEIYQQAQRLMSGDRLALSRSITLVESSAPRHKTRSNYLFRCILDMQRKEEEKRRNKGEPPKKPALRIGVSGTPGAGKSTFIECLGSFLVRELGLRVAVLSIDPSSVRHGGSILGDKTRMTILSQHPNAYVRPSPTGGTLGGVSRATQENILLCEAAAYEVVLVETVGVGQSEVAASNMVDLLLLLVAPAGGDDLQGIKKGIMEVADLVVVNKADGRLLSTARHTKVDYMHALQLLSPRHSFWRPQVVLFSSLPGNRSDTSASSRALQTGYHGAGHSIAVQQATPEETPATVKPDRSVWSPKQLWQEVERFFALLMEGGQNSPRLTEFRASQRRQWMWSLLQEEFVSRMRLQQRTGGALEPLLRRLCTELDQGTLTPRLASDAVLEAVLVPESTLAPKTSKPKRASG
eukprot:g72400.t1